MFVSLPAYSSHALALGVARSVDSWRETARQAAEEMPVQDGPSSRRSLRVFGYLSVLLRGMYIGVYISASARMRPGEGHTSGLLFLQSLRTVEEGLKSFRGRLRK